jgi:GTP-binding protein HflX
MKLETDRRAINQHIHTLEERIARMKRQRETQRARRRSGDTPAVALVGYTNAGKSTLLNALTGASAFVEDKLFATLDPTTRRAALPSGMTVVFTDTVGFINRLPTQLAAAFRATLEEVLHTDALIHVVDATGPHYEREIEVTRGVLKDLGAGALPTVMAWNKIDALPPEIDPAFFEPILPPGVAISAREGIGLDRLLNEVQKLFDAARPRVWLRFGYDEYGEVSKIESTAHVLEKIHRGDAIYLLASLPAAMARRLQDRLSSAPPVDPTVEAI